MKWNWERLASVVTAVGHNVLTMFSQDQNCPNLCESTETKKIMDKWKSIMIIAVKQELIKFPGNETVMVKIGSLISIPYKYSRSEWIWDAMIN